MTRAPKARKLRKHPTGISAPCQKGNKCHHCSMLECQHDCHETMEQNELDMTKLAIRAYRQVA